MTDDDLLLLKRIVSTPGVLGGKPRIDGTRIGVTHLLEALAAGDTADEIVESFDYLSHEDIKAALLYGAYVTQSYRKLPAEGASTAIRLDTGPLPYVSPRQFVLSGYVHSHGQMLLRSDNYLDGAPQKRLEILFKDVRFVALPHVMDGLTLGLGSPSQLRPYVDDLTRLEFDYGIKLYELNGNGWKGIVVGGAVWMAEDDAPPNAPSSLGGVIAFGNPFGLID